MLIKLRHFSSFLVLLVLAQQPWAEGIVMNNESLRSDLNWLNQQGVIQLSTSTWPLSGDEIQRALSQANIHNSAQRLIIESIKKTLNLEKEKIKVDLFVQTNQLNIPQHFANSEKSQYQASLEMNASGEHWDGRLQINAENKQLIDNGHKVNIEGSYLAAKLWNQWLIAGQIPTYWGPGHDGSLIRGDASRPVYGVTMQRAQQPAFESKWLSWIGPWQYQAFIGQLDHYEAIPDAKLLGLRVTAQPLPYLELGASRILQWGGQGRSESWNSLWNAIKGNDNFYNGDDDKSNQIAGFDARLNLKPLLNLPAGLYGQYVGEDEAGYLPSKKMYLAGFDFSSELKDMPFQLYTEWVDTRTNGTTKGISYNHYIYKDGFYQYGFPLGHAIGGDGQMISVGGNIQLNVKDRLQARVLTAKLNDSNRATNYAFPTKDKMQAIDFTWSHDIYPELPVKMSAWVSHSDQYDQDSGLSLGVEIPLKQSFK